MSPTKVDGQVQRVAKRFALAAAAGELAIGFGILPLPKGEVHRAAAVCFKDWLMQRGGSESAEVLKGIQQVRDFVLRHSARFSSGSELGDHIRDRVGIRKSETGEMWVFPESFRKEACHGLDPKTVATALADRGMLRPDTDGNFTRAERVPGLGKIRVYTLLADRGYDSNALRAQTASQGGYANIRPKSNRIDPPVFSPFAYRL